jgi:flagellar motor component MotA
MRVLGFLFISFGLLIVIFIAAGGNLNAMSTFVDWPSVLPLLLTVTGVIMGTGSFKTFVVGFNAAISRKYRISDEQREDAIDLFNMLSKVIYYVTAATTLIGMILTLYTLSDPAALGGKVAIMLVSLFYGAIVNLLFIQPTIYVLKKRQTEEPARVARIRDKAAIDKLVQLCFEKGLTYEDIMEADDIQLRKFQ